MGKLSGFWSGEGKKSGRLVRKAGRGMATAECGGSGLGFWYSSRNPPLQVGQRRSSVGNKVMVTVWLHW